MIWAVVLCGAAMAAGVWLMAGALRRTPPRLAGADVGPRVGVSVAARRQAAPEVGQRLDRRGGGLGTSEVLDSPFYRDLDRDLRVVDDTIETILYHQLLLAITGFAFPLVLLLVIFPIGGLTVPPLVAVLLAVVGGLAGAWLPIHTLRTEAAARRREFGAGLAQYLSFVDVMVSGGNSIDASFEFAAELGDGWVWDELRFAIASASSATLAPYRALQDLGHELGVVELTNLARRLEQTQSTGSAIGPALRSLADSLTRDQARQVKIADDEVTEKMTFPLMVVLCSLLTFFGIAAVTAILRAAQGF
ncbi:MAG: type II secretion system F family protein [Actinomycetota bacterium]